MALYSTPRDSRYVLVMIMSVGLGDATTTSSVFFLGVRVNIDAILSMLRLDAG